MAGSLRPALRPLAEFKMDTPHLILRASADRQCVFLSCVHAMTNTIGVMSVHYPEKIRPAADNAIQAGSAVYLLAAGEAARFFDWLHHGITAQEGN